MCLAILMKISQLDDNRLATVDVLGVTRQDRKSVV